MNEMHRYDPEDIESLLLNKEYGELYEEERNFVMRHISSPGEYSQMRQVLHSVVSEDREDVYPPREVKEALLEAWDKHHSRPGWLNFLHLLFIPQSMNGYRATALRLAVAVLALAIVSVSLWLYVQREETGQANRILVLQREMPELLIPVMIKDTQETNIQRREKSLPAPKPQLVNTDTQGNPPPVILSARRSVSMQEDQDMLSLLYTAL